MLRIRKFLRRIIREIKLLKGLAFLINKILLIFFRFLFSFSKQIQKIYVFLSFQNDWFLANRVPKNYRQEYNLYTWIFNPQNVHFAVSPSLARTHLDSDSVVLDIGCGDGTIDYLFFSDIAKRIDGVDISESGINYAKRHYKQKNLNYYKTNILDFQPENLPYDFVFWADSIDYFSKEEINDILMLLKEWVKIDGHILIKTPLSEKSPISDSNHMKSFQSNQDSFADYLSNYFNVVYKNVTDYGFRKDIDILLKNK
tara:strand:+ start:15928 stop:16695 length:768 start_codon:yes stop_codon:yes gene_type:complete